MGNLSKADEEILTLAERTEFNRLLAKWTELGHGYVNPPIGGGNRVTSWDDCYPAHRPILVAKMRHGIHMETGIRP